MGVLGEAAEPKLGLPDALTTIERALAYDAPLRRRTEGLTWILFGLASALVATSYVSLTAAGVSWSAFYALWLGVYPLIVLGGALLAWRIPGVLHGGVALEARRIVTGALVLAAVLFVQTEVAWWRGPSALGSAFGTMSAVVVPWAFLGLVQWSRLSGLGRRLTWAVGGVMAVTAAAALLWVEGPAGEADDAFVFALAAGGIPFLAGVWHSLRA